MKLRSVKHFINKIPDTTFYMLDFQFFNVKNSIENPAYNMIYTKTYWPVHHIMTNARLVIVESIRDKK